MTTGNTPQEDESTMTSEPETRDERREIIPIAATELAPIEAVTLEAELNEDVASSDIAKAVSARHSIARKYVMRLRRRRPDASPAEVIRMLERNYATAITTAGAVIAAGAIAADVAIAMIPIAGPATAGIKSAGTQAAKKAGKEAAKSAVKGMALGVAKSGAQQVAGLLPAGDEQLQFEITAIFGLAIADIHGMELDQSQAQALVYGLTNERVSQEQIAIMATDIATVSAGGVVDVGHRVAAGRTDWSSWANTLADTLPGGAAQSLVRTMQTGELDALRENLTGKQQTTIEYGVAAVAGGVTRFVFGRDVVNSARLAFAEPPESFPMHLSLAGKEISVPSEIEGESNRALAALEDAATATGSWLAGTAGTVGGGVASAAGTVTRPFRSVDLDGDGIPDEPRALTTVKSVGGSVAGLFKSKKRDLQPAVAPGAGSDSDEGQLDARS